MLSYSNFGADPVGSPASVHKAVEMLHKQYPDMVVDGEMQVNYALDSKLRDKKYPFTRLRDKEVNTLVFPNLSSANSAYKLLKETGMNDFIGPIQMGLNKPVHILDVDTSVRDIVNMVAVAVIDAIVEENIRENNLVRIV
jgi:malate dehydrogenase (oxaloacetate-decarboxylating)(NADP+)